MNNFERPDDKRLERLIYEAHEYLPGPDMARLRGIEERLDRKAARQQPARVRSVLWWLILLLAGGAATAAWWSLEPLRDRNDMPQAVQPETMPGGSEPTRKKRETGSQSAPATGEHPDSPVIYQRQE